MQYLFDFLGINLSNMFTLLDVIIVVIQLWAGMTFLRIIFNFLSNIFPGGNRSIFKM